MLMAAISDAVLAVDLEGAPIFFNSRFAVLVGHGNVASRRIWKLFVEPELIGGFQKALKDAVTVSVDAVPFSLSTGRRFYSVSISPLKRDSGETFGAIGVFHDVTDLKRAEQIRIDFVANVSHELRTPLTTIKGYTDTLIQDVDAGRAVSKEFLQIISRNTGRLIDLIHDLLDLSTIESTDMLQKTTINTGDLTKRVIDQFEKRVEEKEQLLTVKDDLGSVEGDAGRIEQVLSNLLDNACKYTPKGGRISVVWERDGHQSSILKIFDNGPGIPQEHQSRLFERFYRVDKARSRALGGTGLGLAIVKHIMERHGGSIVLESAVGKGTTFICKFPL